LIEFIGQYPALQRTQVCEVKSGQVWTHTLEVWPLPQGISDFPGLKQVVRITREVFHKQTQQTKTGIAFAITNLECSAADLLPLDRSRWGVENKSHHTRDTVFLEDASRTRKGAQTFAVLRNAINGLLRQLHSPVLRSVRRFAAQPAILLKLLQPK
jgi:predicted transposase YbfD/YdcC